MLVLFEEFFEDLFAEERPRIYEDPGADYFSAKFRFVMENKSLEVLHDKNEDEMRNEVIGCSCPKTDEKNVPGPVSTPGRKDTQVNMADSLGAKYAPYDAAHGVMDSSGEVNMEASMTPDDVIRAGGFGARDDIGSFLPVASDSTDFEASIRDARGYEEPQGEICRPGLGWKGAMKTE